jgi:hypothetical protein
MKSTVDAPDWSTIPAPVDDGAISHLMGALMASVPLKATNGETVDLSKLRGRTIIYAYPRTGRPGVENPEGWDMIPGARGCTPQTCSFRDHFAELKALEVDHLFGLSTQDQEYQREDGIEDGESQSDSAIGISRTRHCRSYCARATARDPDRDLS